MKKKIRGAVDDASVDMTSMLDIVFIMLIFFIVSSTFLHETGLSITEHRENDTPENETKPAKAIVIRICSDQRILVDQRAIDVRSVRANVERKLAEDSRSHVVIETENEANTGLLVATMDQVRIAKANLSVSAAPMSCGDSNSSAL